MTRSERYFKKGFGGRKQYKKSSRKEERVLVKSIARSTDLESYYNNDSLLVPLKARSIGMMTEELECSIPTKFLHGKMRKADKEDGESRFRCKPVKGGIMLS